MKMKRQQKILIGLLVIIGTLSFGLGFCVCSIVTPTTENIVIDGSIEVYKLDAHEFPFPENTTYFGPRGTLWNGTFGTDDGVLGDFPANNILWKNDVFMITIQPALINTHFTIEMNLTLGQDVCLYSGWLINIHR